MLQQRAERIDAAPPSPLGRRALVVLWPAFLMAGVLEMVVFAVVDPSALHGFDATALQWSRSAVYSLAFFVFWGVIACASAITMWLDAPSA
jgi:hypothetical protein